MSFLYQNVRVVVVAALFIALLPAASRSQRLAKRGLDPQRLSQIGTRMESLVAERAIVGAVTLVARNGRVFHLEATGFRYFGLGWGLRGDPMTDFPLTSSGSYGHNGAFGSIIWVDPKEGLVRIFLEQLFGAGNEIDIFMALAGAAVVN